VFGETFNPDLAIVELHKEVKFMPDSIAPICLPSGLNFTLLDSAVTSYSHILP
jgi:hypothetical protein